MTERNLLKLHKNPHQAQNPTESVKNINDFSRSIERLENITDVFSVGDFLSSEELFSARKTRDIALLNKIDQGVKSAPAGHYLISADHKTVGVVINAQYDDSVDYEEIAAIKRTIGEITRLQEEFSPKLGRPILMGDVVVDDMVSRAIGEDI
ncbi:MAG: hypothetical protein V1912_13160, partial [bacterium]